MSDQRGQATVELALTLPLVLTLALVLVQVAVVATQQLAVVEAARAAARAAAVAPPGGADTAARAAATMAAPGLEADRLVVRVTFTADGTAATAEVRYRAEGRVPLAGRLLPVVELTAVEAMPTDADEQGLAAVRPGRRLPPALSNAAAVAGLASRGWRR